MFAFLSEYDVVKVAIALNTDKLAPFGLQWLPKRLFGAIDFKSMESEKGSDQKYFAVYEPMAECLRLGLRCAVIVFPDIAGSTYWGDTSMSPRKGLYAASLSLGVPIVDIVHFEPSVEADESTVYVSVHRPKNIASQPRPHMMSMDQYSTWRHDNNCSILSWRNRCADAYMSVVHAHEENYGVCHETNDSVCQENRIVSSNLMRNRKARAVIDAENQVCGHVNERLL